MQLFVLSKFRRSIGLAVLLFFAIPFGISITGCGHKSAPPVYCNNLSSGPVVGQVAFITLSPTLATTGESLSYGQQGQTLSASATDCHGTAVSVSKFVYASSNPNIADINPSNGQICAGLWNHNSGGGVADYTTCIPPATPPASNPVVYVTATAEGTVSNSVPVYIHAPVTSIVLGQPSTNCTTDPATNCNCANGTVQTPTAPAYDQASCVSQGQTRQLVARVYANNSQTSANNITCQVGHLTFAAQSAASVLNIDENGVATANQPGSTIVTASVANSSSAGSAGFFSTCPPASIVLSAPGAAGGNSINVSLNNLTPLTANVYDKNGVQITGVSLEYVSTTPETIPATTGSVTPIFPGSATITAVCQPNSCNPAPFSQTGYLGNGTPLTSNGITVTTPGSSSTVLYMGSTQSQYIYPYDFTTNQPSSLIKLVFVPNSMVMAQTGATIFLGSAQGMMEVSTASNSQTSVYTTIQGTVLAASPDGTTVVVTDPARQTISLVSGATGAIVTQYNGIGTSAQFTPDNQTVYITTTGNTLLIHNNANNWQTETTSEVYSDVAITVPAIGAYFGGRTTTEGRSYCPSILSTTPGTPPSETDEFAPLADTKPVITDQLAATTDGVHILGASANPAVLTDIVPTLPASSACPATVNPGYFTSTVVPHPLANITASSITGVVPATNSALSFVTYTGTSGLLPEYVPNASGTGTVSYITLGNGATAASAPVAGVFSTDNLHFYAGTSGDNQVHLFSINGTTATETGVIATKLPCSVGSNLSPTPACADGTVVAPNLISQRPKKSLD